MSVKHILRFAAGSLAFAAVFLFLIVIIARSLSASAKDTRPPVVIAAEAEMQRDVPIYNQVAPRLKANRSAMEQHGYCFSDEKMTAVKCDQVFPTR